jgi:hypothetical protein
MKHLFVNLKNTVLLNCVDAHYNFKASTSLFYLLDEFARQAPQLWAEVHF